MMYVAGDYQKCLAEAMNNTAIEVENYDKFVRENYVNMLLQKIDILEKKITILEENLKQQTYNKTNSTNT